VKIFFGFVLATIVWAVILNLIPTSDVKVYDCSMAEFHPDFPLDVKEECRKIRGQNRNGYV
jgi:hypothetical protein